MKKVLTFLATLLVIFLLVSCAPAQPAAVEKPAAEATTAPAAEATAAPAAEATAAPAAETTGNVKGVDVPIEILGCCSEYGSYIPTTGSCSLATSH